MSSESRRLALARHHQLVHRGQSGYLVAEQTASGPRVSVELAVVRHRSLPRHSRIDHGEEEVDDELEHHIGDGDHQGDALDHQVVPLLDSLHQRVPQPVDGEQVLDDERPGDAGPRC